MTVAVIEQTATQRWQRRRDALAVLSPRVVPSARVELAVELAMRFSCHVKPVVPGDDGVRADKSRRVIYAVPIVDDATLAEFCHEIGHLEDRVVDRPSLAMGARCTVSMLGEVEAWAFAARVLGRRWTRSMHDHASRCLWSYREHGQYIQDGATERKAMDDFIAASFDQSRHVVRAFPVRR